MIESACRIAVVTVVFLVWLAMGIMPFAARANDDDDYKPKPKPPVVTVPQPASSPSENRKTENLVGGLLASGIATNVLRNQEYGYLWGFGATVAGVVAIESLHSDPKMSNIWYGVGGAMLGTYGSCKLLVAKSYIGCAIPF